MIHLELTQPILLPSRKAKLDIQSFWILSLIKVILQSFGQKETALEAICITERPDMARIIKSGHMGGEPPPKYLVEGEQVLVLLVNDVSTNYAIIEYRE